MKILFKPILDKENSIDSNFFHLNCISTKKMQMHLNNGLKKL